MADLPTGTITFLFTDIAGSTALWEQYPDVARAALARHDALVEQIVAAHTGQVVKPRGEGDSRFAVFARATDAVTAAAALQQALFVEPWPTPSPLRVRMALHTGEADLRDGDYYGTAVNRCARLRAVAHGGQTLVSLATEQLVRDHLPDSVKLRDLGEHRLKDLARPEHIFQIVTANLPGDFPPLKTLNSRPHNLPAQTTSLIGREREVAAVIALLRRADVRLVTLTGPGGTGKTRLALQVAADLLDDFPDGVWFVDLAPITDPALVAATMAHTLGVKEAGGQPLVESLKTYLRDKQLLLVLDNFEQVAAAALVVTELLKVAPRLKLLVTSRVVLHLSGEHEFAVPPLALPDLQEAASVDRLTQYAAVTLFIQRAQAVKSDFQLTHTTARAVAEICVRLDGLPLAIELAAARVKLLPPLALLARLSTRLHVLTGGASDLPARQRTLRRTIDWSYDLLAPDEQTLFRRLGVFVGGCTLAAVEAVCNATGDLPGDILAGLGSLLDKSLLQQQETAGGELRFTLLETLREYAWEQLVAHGEAMALRGLHAAYYLALAEAAEPALTGTQQAAWLAWLELEHANLRAALTWLLEQAEGHEADLAARLCRALTLFWIARNHLAEGRHWFAAVLAGTSRHSPALRTQLLISSGQLAREHGDLAQAQVLLEQGLAHARAMGDRLHAGDALAHLHHLALQQGNYTRANQTFEESLPLLQETGNTIRLARLLLSQAWVAYAQGNLQQAVALFEESLALFRKLGDQRNANYAICCLAFADVLRGEPQLARTRLIESLDWFQQLGDKQGVAYVLEGLVLVSCTQEQVARAARLAGAAEALREAIDVPFFPLLRPYYERSLGTMRAQLGDTAFGAAWAAGRAMSLEQAIAYALDSVPLTR